MTEAADLSDQSIGMPGPDCATEAQVRRAAEHKELIRIAAQRVVDQHAAGRCVDPSSLGWARSVVEATPALGRPLGTGEPR